MQVPKCLPTSVTCPPVVASSFTVPQLEEATGGFGAASLLATGGFGDVHIGVIALEGALEGSTEARVLAKAVGARPSIAVEKMQVAIKVIKASRLQKGAGSSGVESFRRELDVLTHYRKTHLAPKVDHGWCTAGGTLQHRLRLYVIRW